MLKLLPKRGLTTTLRSGMISAVNRRVALLALASAAVMAAPASALDGTVGGYWLTNGGSSIVEIAPCGTSSKRLCGKTVWVADSAASSVGAEVLKSFRPEGKKGGGRYGKGKVVQANGKDRKGKLKLDDGKLTVSSCKGSRCDNVTWTRPSSMMTAEAGLSGGGE